MGPPAKSVREAAWRRLDRVSNLTFKFNRSWINQRAE